MTHTHTPQGTGKRIGTIGERRARFYFRPKHLKNVSKCRALFFEAPWRPYMSGFGGPTHTCDIPMYLPAVPPAIPPCGSAE